MANFDLSKFKKTGSDGKKTTLVHKDGHELIIAHNGLSKKMLGDLEKLPMAEGGQVEPSGAGVNRAKDKNVPGTSRMGEHVREGNAAAAKDAAHKTLREMDRQPKPKIKGLANGGGPADAPDIPAYLQPNAQPDQAPAQAQQVPQSSGASEDWTPAQPQAAPAAPDTQSPPASPVGQALVAPQSPAQIKSAFDDEYLKAKNDYLTGKIAPETYHDLYAKKDTLGKIGTIFGLMLSGAGSGLTHQPNLLMQMMDKQIDRDLEAQKSSKGNELNFLNAVNQHHQAESEIALRGIQGKEAQANIGKIKADTAVANQTVAKTQMLMGGLAHLGGIVDKLPPGPQKQVGQQTLQGLSGELDNKVGQMNSQAAEQQWQQRQGMLNMLSPEMAKFEAERHVPGVSGQSSLPIPEEQRKSFVELKNLDSAASDANDYLHRSGALGAWTPAMRREGAGLQNRLELEIGKLEGLGRFTPEEAKRYKEMIPDLTGTHLTDADQASINNIQKEIHEHQANIRSTYGIPEEKSSKGWAYEGKTATNPKTGEKLVGRNGKWQRAQ